jgi:Flp pilus assembly protein TadB
VSRRSRRLEWGRPDEPSSRRPVRDSLLIYAGFALVIVVFAWITGGSLVKAIVIAAVFYAVASGWVLWRSRRSSGTGN